MALVIAVIRQQSDWKLVFFGDLTWPKILSIAITCGLLLPGLALAAELGVRAALHIPDDGHTITSPNLTFSALALLLAPLAETALFQLWIQSSVKRSPLLAVFVGATLFIAVHLRLDAPLVTVAFAYATVWQRWRSFGAVWLSHAVSNGALIVLTLFT